MLTASPVVSRLSRLGHRAGPPAIARLMTLALEHPGLLSLAAGFTDTATLPAAWLSETTAKLTEPDADLEVLQYGSNQGRPGLRALIARRLAAAEPGLDALTLTSHAMLTNGSQQCLALALQVLCDPGDIVLVDRPTYFVALELMGGLGVDVRSIPATADGSLDVTGLRRLLGDLRASGDVERLKVVYFVSYFSNPSGRSFSLQEKHDLAAALTDYGCMVPVIEDAAYRDLGFHGPSDTATILGDPSWEAFPRLYLGTFSKPFASGLKVGYGICTDEDWRSRMLHLKGHHDFGTANFNQWLVERALITGAYDEQVRRLRKTYHTKMIALDAALDAGGLRKAGWTWSKPAGGLYLWLRAPETVDTGFDGAFCRACLEGGVLYVPGSLCFGDDAPLNFVRLSYGVLSPGDLAEAARRFAHAARVAASD